MNAAQLLALISSLSTAVPELIVLFERLQSGTPVTQADVAAILTKAGLDRATFAADIAAAEAAAAPMGTHDPDAPMPTPPNPGS